MATLNPNRITIYLPDAEAAKRDLEAVAADAGLGSVSGILRRIREAAQQDRPGTVAALRALPQKNG